MSRRISSRPASAPDLDGTWAATTGAVLLDITIAISIVSAAESAFAAGDLGTAGALCRRAEGNLNAILRKICGLTDAEAVSLESQFTELEERLIRLGSDLLKQSSDRE